jgi:CheY-like chemotaxis protein
MTGMDPRQHSSHDSDVDVVMLDDDAVMLDLVHAWLDELHISMKACQLGWHAQSCIRKANPRVVILDIEMPDVDGIQLFYLLRADPRTRDIPVIFLTGYPHKVTSELPNYQEMDAVLVPKPFVGRLIESVTSALANNPCGA